MRIIAPCLALVFALAAAESSASAQRETTTGVSVDKDLALLRRDLRGEKKKILAANLPLTETEATKFWPVYDQYAADMTKHNDEFYLLIKDYTQKQKTITDAEATAMIEKWADLQVRTAQTKQKYLPLVEKVLSGRKTALFFQIDRRLYALMDLQTSMQLPLMIQEK